MAREHGSLSVFAPRKSDVTDTEAPRRADAGHSTPEKAAVLARLRQMRSEGKSLEKMARELNAEGIPTLSGEGRWQKGTLQKLLKSSSSVPATDTAPDTSTDTAADACTRAPVSTAADAVTETRSSGATAILT
jgi:hypothetical protein